MHGIWESMSESNIICVLFISCKIVISAVFLCTKQNLYPALVVKYASPCSTIRGAAGSWHCWLNPLAEQTELTLIYSSPLGWPHVFPRPNIQLFTKHIPDSKVHGANMGPTWVLSVPGEHHVGPMNLAIRDWLYNVFDKSLIYSSTWRWHHASDSSASWPCFIVLLRQTRRMSCSS